MALTFFTRISYYDERHQGQYCKYNQNYDNYHRDQILSSVHSIRMHAVFFSVYISWFNPFTWSEMKKKFVQIYYIEYSIVKWIHIYSVRSMYICIGIVYAFIKITFTNNTYFLNQLVNMPGSKPLSFTVIRNNFIKKTIKQYT